MPNLNTQARTSPNYSWDDCQLGQSIHMARMGKDMTNSDQNGNCILRFYVICAGKIVPLS